MGLDMHAGYLHPKPERSDNVVDIKDDIGNRMEAPYYWRKHARLQEHMTQLWHKKNGGNEYGFNGGDVLILTKEDILELKHLVETDDLPFCQGGFFWGHQFQEQSCAEYKKQDLKFCEDALQWLEEGREVWYESSW